jgi:cytochrome c556
MSKLSRAAALAALALVASAAQAQFAKPEDAIKYRKSVMFVMGQHAGRLGAMVQGKMPWDAATAASNAETIAMLSRLPWPAFAPGTDQGDTRAKPDIWSDNAKFKANAERLQEQTAKLAAAAKSGDEAAVKAAFGEVGKTCKGCHDQFRKE